MSSTERAPEPTMEEILASIRRIITDDEAGQEQAQRPAQEAQAADESLEGEADNQIIDDIARVLSGSGDETPVDQEEEILDLTAELGGLEIVEDDDEQVLEVAEVEEVLEIMDLEEEEATEPVVDVAVSAEAQALVEEIAPEFVQEVMQEMAPPPEMAAAEAVPPLAPQQTPEAPPFAAPEETLSAGEEAASALERAIAALRAGQNPTSTTPPAEPFQFQAAPQPETMTAAAPEAEPQPIPMAVPMPEPEPQAETHPEPEDSFEPLAAPSFDAEFEASSPFEPMDESAAEPELVLTEIETATVEIEETFEDAESEFENAPFWPVEASEDEQQPIEAAAELEPVFDAEPVPEPIFEPESESISEPESVVAQTNGAYHDVAGKSLEDSIKDMLRPMLRQWLDENMPRMIRDELDADTVRRLEE